MQMIENKVYYHKLMQMVENKIVSKNNCNYHKLLLFLAIIIFIIIMHSYYYQYYSSKNYKNRNFNYTFFLLL